MEIFFEMMILGVKAFVVFVCFVLVVAVLVVPLIILDKGGSAWWFLLYITEPLLIGLAMFAFDSATRG